MTSDKTSSDESQIQELLAACRQAGLAEGHWFYDVRAGYCWIDTLQPTHVIVVTASNRPIAIKSAADLYEWYQHGSIHPINQTALANARAIVLAAAQREVERTLRENERDDPWNHSEYATTVADLAAAVAFFERAIEHECTVTTILHNVECRDRSDS